MQNAKKAPPGMVMSRILTVALVMVPLAVLLIPNGMGKRTALLVAVGDSLQDQVNSVEQRIDRKAQDHQVFTFHFSMNRQPQDIRSAFSQSAIPRNHDQDS